MHTKFRLKKHSKILFRVSFYFSKKNWHSWQNDCFNIKKLFRLEALFRIWFRRYGDNAWRTTCSLQQILLENAWLPWTLRRSERVWGNLFMPRRLQTCQKDQKGQKAQVMQEWVTNGFYEMINVKINFPFLFEQKKVQACVTHRKVFLFIFVLKWSNKNQLK